MHLQPDGVVAEAAARQARPLAGVLALLDVLLRCAAPIVEGHHPLSGAAQVGDDEPDARIQLAGMPFHLGNDPVGRLSPVVARRRTSEQVA